MTSSPWWWRKLHPEVIWGTTRLLNESGGLRVTSAWRSWTAQLRLKGGSRTSAHPLGWCVDLVGSAEAMARARDIALGWRCHQVLIHDAGTGVHLHIDFRGARFT